MKDIYNKLSDSYDQLYLQNIQRFQTNLKGKTSPAIPFVDFYPSFGIKRREKLDFLIYGQAVNGWGSGFNIEDKVGAIEDETGKAKIEASLEASNTYLSGKDHNPIDWVNVLWSDASYTNECSDKVSQTFYENDYRTSKSFFWNVVYKLINDYYEFGRNSKKWSGKLVWSNLYKIAPNHANPNEDEKKAQQDISIELVRKEIEELKPTYCIVLTNLDWWEPFQKALPITVIQETGLPDDVVAYEKYGQTQIIVTKRPMVGDSDSFVKQILQLIIK